MGNDNKDKENLENDNQEPENLKPEDQESSGEESSEADFSESESSGEEVEEELTAPESTLESIPETPPEAASESSAEPAPETTPESASEPEIAASASQPDETEEEYEKTTVKQVSLKWGLYIGLVMIVWGLVMQIAGLVDNQYLGFVSYLFLIAGIVLAHKEFKTNGDGFMAYSQGLGIGTLLSVVSGAISAVFSYIYVKFIDDSMLTIVKDLQVEKMEEQGLSDAQIEQAMEIAGKFMVPEVMLPLALLSMVFVGFILSLIVSAFTKNVNPQAEI